MIINLDENKLENLSKVKRQWEFAHSNGLIQMRDRTGKIWILREKLLFANQEEAYRIVSLHQTILARFQSFTCVELPQTYLVSNEGDLTYLTEKITGVSILRKVKDLIDKVNCSSGRKKLKAQSQLNQLANQLEALFMSLFDYFLNSYSLNMPCLVDMKLDQLVVSKNLKFYLVDYDPDFGKISPIFNFFGNLTTLENLLNQVVYDYLEVLKIIQNPNWGKSFVSLVESYGYSIQQLITTPYLSELIGNRLEGFEQAIDVYKDDIIYRSWEI